MLEFKGSRNGQKRTAYWNGRKNTPMLPTKKLEVPVSSGHWEESGASCRTSKSRSFLYIQLEIGVRPSRTGGS